MLKEVVSSKIYNFSYILKKKKEINLRSMKHSCRTDDKSTIVKAGRQRETAKKLRMHSHFLSPVNKFEELITVLYASTRNY
jgi:hypothetical protein